ncbi:CAP domain-containing protein [Hydrogenophaga aromaticivorans]|uniref:CAP domain-containing protein n=1 Tax=Hydrogenophaga aromaticivorans TaxID=2610898 RepID=UPI001B3908C7|nr:CAP domain-containing protein [Hydrogenophaga aromaticivorans]MBQ0916901.1 CAP domain-containing protein [Hydrogenophaga aromaticivorans]
MNRFNAAAKLTAGLIFSTVFLAACGGGGDDGNGGGGDPADVPLSQSPALVQQYAALFNNARSAARNCGAEAMPAVHPLTEWNPKLQAAAQGHADDMNAKGYFSHTRQDGKTVADYGYTGMPTAENLMSGKGSPSATVTVWLNSPGHCAAIMNSLSHTVAVAQSGKYTVMLYGD